MVADHGLSVREACRAARLARSAYYAPSKQRDDGPEIKAIELYIATLPRISATGLTNFIRWCADKALANTGYIGSTRRWE
jgi:hypothetical protein